MKRLVTLLIAVVLSSTAVKAQNQQAPGISPAAPPSAPPPVIAAEAPLTPAPPASAAPAVKQPAPKKVPVVPAVKIAGWTNWPGVEKTPAGNEVLVPFAMRKGKVTLIYQKDLTKGSKQPPKGYYWRRPKDAWYLATNHDLEIRSIAQARQDQLTREGQKAAKH